LRAGVGKKGVAMGERELVKMGSSKRVRALALGRSAPTWWRGPAQGRRHARVEVVEREPSSSRKSPQGADMAERLG
jgi:hypothetical protein